tara:strand:- start:1065 stop:1775 length:711 start_codon:yes stop_codon:yes gene_type:complete
MDYKNKYLKYKIKYLNFKKIFGGMEQTSSLEDSPLIGHDGKLITRPSGQPPDPPPSPPPSPPSEHIVYSQVEPGSGESAIKDLEENLPDKYPPDPEFNNPDNKLELQKKFDRITYASRELPRYEGTNPHEPQDYTQLPENESTKNDVPNIFGRMSDAWVPGPEEAAEPEPVVESTEPLAGPAEPEPVVGPTEPVAGPAEPVAAERVVEAEEAEPVAERAAKIRRLNVSELLDLDEI